MSLSFKAGVGKIVEKKKKAIFSIIKYPSEKVPLPLIRAPFRATPPKHITVHYLTAP